MDRKCYCLFDLYNEIYLGSVLEHIFKTFPIISLWKNIHYDVRIVKKITSYVVVVKFSLKYVVYH